MDYTSLVEINSIDQVAKTDLQVWMFENAASAESLATFEGRVHNISVYDSQMLIRRMVEYRQTTFLLPQIYVEHMVYEAGYFSDAWIVPETFANMHTSMIVPKTSPYIDKFNRVTEKFMETGMVVGEMKKVKTSQLLQLIRQIRNGKMPAEKSVHKVIDTKTMEAPFVLLISLHLLSVLVFGVELLVAKKWSLKKLWRWCCRKVYFMVFE
jgi:hypothetical protein